MSDANTFDAVGVLSGEPEVATPAGRMRCSFVTCPDNSDCMGFWINAPTALFNGLHDTARVHVVGTLKIHTTATSVQYTIYATTLTTA